MKRNAYTPRTGTGNVRKRKKGVGRYKMEGRGKLSGNLYGSIVL
jgi:hypothetical protein